MKIRVIKYFLILALVGLIFSCQKKEQAEKNKFTPPEDNLITKEMAKRYAKVSLALTEIAESEAVNLADFRQKYDISSSMSELDDSEYKKEHPEVAAVWDSLQENWYKRQDSVFSKYGMSEEEWDWIAGALIMPKNKPMREFIVGEFKRLREGVDSLPKQAKDNS